MYPLYPPVPPPMPLVKAHTKLPILEAYPYLSVPQWATEMEIAVRYGYAAIFGSLVRALTKWASDREGRLT